MRLFINDINEARPIWRDATNTRVTNKDFPLMDILLWQVKICKQDVDVNVNIFSSDCLVFIKD